jgi:hypothetical protein
MVNLGIFCKLFSKLSFYSLQLFTKHVRFYPPISGIGPITGTLQVGSTLTAGVVTPSGATVSYQWYRSSSATTGYSQIAGATGSSYTLTTADAGKYLKVKATGYGSYSGYAFSSATGLVNSLSGEEAEEVKE